MPRVIIPPEIVNAIRVHTSERTPFLRILNTLHALGDDPLPHRTERTPSDPDRLFDFPVSVRVQGRWIHLIFRVDDATSPDHLFIESIAPRTSGAN